MSCFQAHVCDGFTAQGRKPLITSPAPVFEEIK